MRILIIEDDKNLAKLLQRGLDEHKYAVDVSHNGEEGEEMAQAAEYDLIILDIILPKKNGIDVCLALRESDNTARIIMLTSKDTVDDRIKGLDSGADDYMVKPFAFDELLARIRALFRRELNNGSNLLRAGHVVMDTLTHRVKCNGEDIPLSSKEYAMLEYFLRNPDIVLTRSMIENHLWDFSFESSSNIVDVYIGRLRKKLDIPDHPAVIETIRNIGYRLNAQGSNDEYQA